MATAIRTQLRASSLYLITSNMVGAGAGFIFWAAAARLYPAREVGLAAAAISSISLLAMLATLGLDFALVRFLPTSRDPGRVINSAVSISGVSACVVSFAFVAGLAVWSPTLASLRSDVLWVGAIVAAVAFMSLSTLFAAVYLIRQRTDLVLVHAVIFGTVKTVLAFLFASTAKAIGLTGAWALGTMAAATAGIFVFLPRVEDSYRFRPTVDRSAMREMTRFASANYVATLLWGAPNLLLPLLVINLVGPEANAYFYVTSSISGLIAMIPMAVSLSLFAHGSLDDSHLLNFSTGGLKLALLLQVPAIATVFALGGGILSLFGRAYADEGAVLLRLMVLATLPMTINFLLFGVRRVQRRMSEVVAYSVWILVATLLFSAVLLPPRGLPGVGLAFLIAHASTALLIVARRAFAAPLVRVGYRIP